MEERTRWHDPCILQKNANVKYIDYFGDNESKKTIEQIVNYTKFFDISGQAIIISDEDRIIIYCNNEAKRLFGSSIDNAKGKRLDDFLAAIFRPELTELILNSLLAGKSWCGELELTKQDLSTTWLLTNFSPMFTQSGQPLGSVSFSTDISEQKWAERELAAYAVEFAGSLEKIQELNEKLQTVGGLARHDIRNKLSGVNGRIYLLKKSLTGNELAMNHVNEIEKINKEILAILDFEHAYEQVGAQQLTFIQVETAFGEATALVTDSKGIKMNCQSNGLSVKADSLLRQLFYNLIDNTMKYGQKTTEIKLYSEEENSGLKLIYEDNGVGISEEMREHLFEKGFGRGTGLGLFLMKRICQTYGWVISEQGSLNKGAKFVMFIPNGNYLLTNQETMKAT